MSKETNQPSLHIAKILTAEEAQDILAPAGKKKQVKTTQPSITNTLNEGNTGSLGNNNSFNIDNHAVGIQTFNPLHQPETDTGISHIHAEPKIELSIEGKPVIDNELTPAETTVIEGSFTEHPGDEQRKTILETVADTIFGQYIQSGSNLTLEDFTRETVLGVINRTVEPRRPTKMKKASDDLDKRLPTLHRSDKPISIEWKSSFDRIIALVARYRYLTSQQLNPLLGRTHGSKTLTQEETSQLFHGHYLNAYWIRPTHFSDGIPRIYYLDSKGKRAVHRQGVSTEHLPNTYEVSDLRPEFFAKLLHMLGV